MARIRREKTLADYVVIALSPALIMTLVGSLAFFLLAVAYRGQFETRVHWVLFWFVMGAVLVARIAIEQGQERAHLLGWILAGVTALFAYRYLEPDVVVIAWVLLAVIWWCSWKLTWDCTLIDDGEDASGEGLIEAAGLAVESVGDATQVSGSQQPDRSLHADADAADYRLPLWRRWLAASAARRGRPHAPGLWVVYFSLAALPLFGVGQLLIPAADADRRSYAFRLLAVYVASALGLLLTTSFLGLRRYLRQRKLQMPAAMTATWIGMGTALAIALLLLALLIPRPQGEYTITEWIEKADTKVREASRLAMLRDKQGGGQGEGRRIGAHDPNAGQPGQIPPPQDAQKNAANPPQQQPPQGAEQQQAGQPGGDRKQQDPGGRDGQKPAQGGPKSDRDGKQQEAQADGKGQQQKEAQRDARGDAAKHNPQQADGKKGQPPDQDQQQADANQRRDQQPRPGEKPPRDQNVNAPNQTPPPSPVDSPLEFMDKQPADIARAVRQMDSVCAAGRRCHLLRVPALGRLC